MPKKINEIAVKLLALSIEPVNSGTVQRSNREDDAAADAVRGRAVAPVAQRIVEAGPLILRFRFVH